MIAPEHLAVKGSPYFEIGHLAEDEIACSAPASQTEIGIHAKFVHSIVDLPKSGSDLFGRPADAECAYRLRVGVRRSF
jgi:hypothetical protein